MILNLYRIVCLTDYFHQSHCLTYKQSVYLLDYLDVQKKDNNLHILFLLFLNLTKLLNFEFLKSIWYYLCNQNVTDHFFFNQVESYGHMYTINAHKLGDIFNESKIKYLPNCLFA